MADFGSDSHVLGVFQERCRRAGTPAAGFNLRRQSIQYGASEVERAASDEAIARLVAAGLLISNEAGDRLILTADGVAALSD